MDNKASKKNTHNIENSMHVTNDVNSPVALDNNMQVTNEVNKTVDMTNPVLEIQEIGEKTVEVVLETQLNIKQNVRTDKSESSDEECEEVWCDEYRPLREIMSQVRVENIEEMHTGACLGDLALECASEREEGEIPTLMGKEKLYESDVEHSSISRNSKRIEELSVRKSQRVHTRSQKLNL